MFEIDKNLVELVLWLIFDTLVFATGCFNLWYLLFDEEPEPPKRRYGIRRIH